jgi:hypothetical protein
MSSYHAAFTCYLACLITQNIIIIAIIIVIIISIIIINAPTDKTY